MPSTYRNWLRNIPINDPLQRRQAGLFQIILLILIAASLIGLPLGIMTRSSTSVSFLGEIAYTLLAGCNITAFIILRRGHFTASVMLVATSLMAVLGFVLIGTALTNGSGVLLAFTVPIVLAGLLLGRRALILFTGASVALVILIIVFGRLAPTLVGFIHNPPSTPIASATVFILIIIVLGLFLDLFGTSLRDALVSARVREHELEQLRASLETTVTERTASLEQALQAGELRESRLTQALEDLGTSQETIRELSAPVIPVLQGVLVAPLIGAVDSRRAATLTDNVLRMVERERASHVIFDITGVPLVDTQVAQVLLQATMSVRLLGAQALLVGIRPEVAQTIVALNIDLAAIKTFSSLREAIAALQTARPIAVAVI